MEPNLCLAHVASNAKAFLFTAGGVCAVFGGITAYFTTMTYEDPKPWIRLSVFGLLQVYISVFL